MAIEYTVFAFSAIGTGSENFIVKKEDAQRAISLRRNRPIFFIDIAVPRDIDLVKIETDGGAIVTTGISGRLEAESGGGTIHLDDIGGAISAETGGGAIDVGNVG